MARKKGDGRPRTDFGRGRGRRRSGRQLHLIVCEGEKTERLYFLALNSDRRRSTAEAVVIAAGEPSSVVERAVRERETAPVRYDHVWCVFDRDAHGAFEAALTEASRQHLEVVLSVPCFEVWFLLHFGYTTRSLSSPRVLERLRAHLPDYEKSRDVYEVLLPHQEAALSNAEKLRQHHESAGSGPYPNPSTDVDRLIRALLDLAAP